MKRVSMIMIRSAPCRSRVKELLWSSFCFITWGSKLPIEHELISHSLSQSRKFAGSGGRDFGNSWEKYAFWGDLTLIPAKNLLMQRATFSIKLTRSTKNHPCSNLLLLKQPQMVIASSVSPEPLINKSYQLAQRESFNETLKRKVKRYKRNPLILLLSLGSKNNLKLYWCKFAKIMVE